MIKHIVMWRLRPGDPKQQEQDLMQVKSAFEGIREKIPGLLRLEIGFDISKVDYACAVVLYSEFATQEDLNTYATHPEHTRVRQELEGIRVERYQVDYIV